MALPVHSKQPMRFDALVEQLADLSPKVRIVRASKYLDTLLAVGTPLQQVSGTIRTLQKRARGWKDGELAGYLTFYDKIKGALLPVSDEEILAVFGAALNDFEKRNDHRYAGVCHYFIGQHHYERRQYGEAFFHHAKAQELFNEVGIANILDIGKYLHVMALNYYYFRDYGRVIQLMRASISLPPFDDNLDIQRYNTLGLAYKQRNQLDSAAFYFKRTQEVAASWRDTTWINLAAGNLGSVYVAQGRYREALPFLMQDYQHSQHEDHHPVLARNAAVDIAATWQKLNQLDSAIHYLQESERLNAVVRNGEPMWKQQRDEQYYVDYYRVYHRYFKALDDTEKAYRYLDSLTTLTQETNQRYNTMTARVAEDRLKIQQYEVDIALREAEKSRIRVRFQLTVGIVGAIALLLALLYYLLRLRHTRARLQAEKQQVLQQAAREKIEAKLAQANMELEEYMLRLAEKNNLIKSFEAQIDALRVDAVQQTYYLDDLTARLAETKLLTPDDWADFRRRFNRAFEGELDQLKLRYRDLTSAEERIYALEKMNVSTSQMAWMLGIAPESVRKARYRLRKKIDHRAD